MVSTPSDSDEHESGDDADPVAILSGGGARWEFHTDFGPTTWAVTTGTNYTINGDGVFISTATPTNPQASQEYQGFDMSVYSASMTHFQEWMDRLIGDGEVRFNYQGGNTNPPFFNHGSYRDYEYVMEISGHTIMGYADGSPRVPEGGTEIRFPLASEEGNGVMIGYTTTQGIFLSMDPRYLRFVTRNEETGLWDHVEAGEGEPNACHIFLEAIGAEAFYRRWRPPTLEDIMQRSWLQKRDRQISTANRRISDLANGISEQEARVENSRKLLVQARATLGEWGHMTLEKFMESINVYRDQLDGIGNDLQVTDEAVSILLNAFEVQGVTLGPLRISFSLAESRIKVHPDGNCVQSRSGHIHPHISGETVCWGEHERIYNASLGNPFEALFLTAGFLKTGYSAAGAYCRLESWTANDNYYCEFCSARHPNGSGCPAECGECNRQVDWNVHAHCPTHFLCHDTNDGNDGCATCVQEREETEKKRVAELEAKQAEQKNLARSTKKKTKKKATKKKVRKKASKRQSRRTITPVPEAAE